MPVNYIQFCAKVVDELRGTSAILEAEFEAAKEIALSPCQLTGRRVESVCAASCTGPSLALALSHEGGNDQRPEHNKRQPDPSKNVISDVLDRN